MGRIFKFVFMTCCSTFIWLFFKLQAKITPFLFYSKHSSFFVRQDIIWSYQLTIISSEGLDKCFFMLYICRQRTWNQYQKNEKVWNKSRKWCNFTTNIDCLLLFWWGEGRSILAKGCEFYKVRSLFCCIISDVFLWIFILKFIINGGDVYNKRSLNLLITIRTFM